MLTLLALPKAFDGKTGELQEVALASWRALGSAVQIVLVGDEPGVAEAAADAGVQHIDSIACNPRGTPRLDSALARVDAVAEHPLRLFLNADIVLLPDLLDAVTHVDTAKPFLLVGETRELAVTRSDLDNTTELRARALTHGTRRGPAAIDWFVFPAGLFDPVPTFVVGRSSFDNWLIWRGRQRGRVVDATHDVVAIHQPHGYGHIAGGKVAAYYGAEARENLRLAGGKRHLYTLHDASHRLVAGQLHRNAGAVFRWRDRARKAAYKLRRGPV